MTSVCAWNSPTAHERRWTCNRICADRFFGPLRSDPQLFRSVKVDKRMGTIVWDNGADMDPDVLYLGLKPAWMETERMRL